jgi:hypothetical protein
VDDIEVPKEMLQPEVDVVDFAPEDGLMLENADAIP